MDYHSILVSELLLAHNYSIANRDMVEAFTTTTFDCLHHWLDVNAKTDEVMELELTDYIGRYTEMDETQYLNSLKTVAIASCAAPALRAAPLARFPSSPGIKSPQRPRLCDRERMRRKENVCNLWRRDQEHC